MTEMHKKVVGFFSAVVEKVFTHRAAIEQPGPFKTESQFL